MAALPGKGHFHCQLLTRLPNFFKNNFKKSLRKKRRGRRQTRWRQFDTYFLKKAFQIITPFNNFYYDKKGIITYNQSMKKKDYRKQTII
ncbi:hypothetical protein GCM10020331_006140 [Ectobacillus funiculus]